MDNTAAQTINLLLLNDHEMFRQGLARVLEKEPGLKVVAQYSTSAQAIEVLKKSGANMVLLDVDLGPERALDFVTRAKKMALKDRFSWSPPASAVSRPFSWCRRAWPES